MFEALCHAASLTADSDRNTEYAANVTPNINKFWKVESII